MKKNKLLYLALPFLLGAGLLLIPRPDYRYEPAAPPPTTFEEYRGRRSASQKIRPNNESKLVRFSEEPTEMAILYVHGFGSSRGEGELVVDRIAETFQANTFYLRLPGHGTDKEDLREQTPDDYLNEVERTLRAMPLLGRNVIVIGTSFGGLLATHLAAAHPEKIAGLILTSPFYEFAPLDARIMGQQMLRPFFRVLIGHKVRINIKDPETMLGPNKPRGPDYLDYWYNEKYTESYLPLAVLRDRIVRRDTFARISMPVLLLYYYRDEEHQDPSASVRAMLDRFAEMGRSPSFRGPVAGHPLNRAVAVENGAHVMLSEHVKSDHETAHLEMEAFLKAVRAQLPSAARPDDGDGKGEQG